MIPEESMDWCRRQYWARTTESIRSILESVRIQEAGGMRIPEYVLINCMLYFSYVMSTQEGGSGSSSGSGAGTELIDECMQQFISSEITYNIMEWTPVIYGLVEDGILELLDNHLGVFRVKIVAGQLGAHLEPKACGSYFQLLSFMIGGGLCTMSSGESTT